MESKITLLCTALCGQQSSCEIDKLQAPIFSAQIGMECRQSNVGFGLVIDLSVDIQIFSSWFEPSSTIKVVLYRRSKINLGHFDSLVGQYKGKVVDLLENSQYNVRYMRAFMLKTI